MNIYRITIYNCISEKKRRMNISAWNITEAAECMLGRLNSGAEEIIKIERWQKNI